MSEPGVSPFVFISYSRADNTIVTRLQADLQAHGVYAWLDRESLQPGTPDWEEALRTAIRAAYAVLLVASAHARSSRYVKDELRIAEMYQRKVYPVWVAGTQWMEAIPIGWGGTQFIDVREEHYHLGIQKLTYILKQLASEVPSLSLTTPPPDLDFEPRNPYKGLRPFTRGDAQDFFGREKLIDELAATLGQSLNSAWSADTQARLLAVVGPSGSGKSSVVMAGLLPQLQQGALLESKEWVFLEPMMPGRHPFDALALTLSSFFPSRSLKTIREDLEDDSSRGLHLLATSLMKRPEAKVVLLIDQFEELFTQTSFDDERRRFIDLLVTAVTEPRGPLIVILTLRADFYDRPMHYPELGQLIEAHHKLVFSMEMQDLRNVIEKPAALLDVQLNFEGNLVGDLLFEMQGQVGALPLLQFALDQLFQRRNGHLLTLQAYHEIGGVKGALTKQAEETYTALPSEKQRQLARALFTRLIDLGMMEQDITRRRATVSEFSLPDPTQTELLRETIDAFTEARLLMTNQVAGVTTIEVSHEALIREWMRLAGWLRDARDDIRLQQTISEDTAEWERNGKPRDRLYRGSQLTDARTWATHNISSGGEAAFLRSSAAHQIRSRISRIVILLLVLLLAIPTGMLVRQLFLPNVTTLKDDGPGSLRQAIVTAQSGSTIKFDPSLRGPIVLAREDLVISKNLTILGPGTDALSISGGKSKLRVHILRGVSVTISSLSFKGSKLTYIIFNEGTLALTNSILSDNTAFGFSGGAIANTGSLTLMKCIVSSNTVHQGRGGGITNYQGTLTLINSMVFGNTATNDNGGGISNYQGTLTLINSMVFGNTATRGNGGGISNYQGKIMLTNSKISGNRAISGGGISNYGSVLTLINSTVSGNSSNGDNGGGISNYGSVLTLTNSTVSGNSSDGGNGGGISNKRFGNISGTLTIINSTISGNRAIDHNGYGGRGSAIFILDSQASITFCTIYGNGNASTHDGGGITIENDGHSTPNQVVVRNSIIAANHADHGPDISGNLTSYGYNLIEDISGAAFDPNKQHLTDIIEVQSTNLRIDPQLADFGGLTQPPTLTHQLLPTSPAIDQIPFSACLLNGISTDQRGVKRPQGSACDIGSYEYILS